VSVSVMNTQAETSTCNYTAWWNMYVRLRTWPGISGSFKKYALYKDG
jgi:hypothetical protein